MFNSPITANISLTNIPCTSPVRHAKGKYIKITPKSFFTYQIFSSVQVFLKKYFLKLPAYIGKVFFATNLVEWLSLLVPHIDIGDVILILEPYGRSIFNISDISSLTMRNTQHGGARYSWCPWSFLRAPLTSSSQHQYDVRYNNGESGCA